MCAWRSGEVVGVLIEPTLGWCSQNPLLIVSLHTTKRKYFAGGVRSTCSAASKRTEDKNKGPVSTFYAVSAFS